MRTYILRKRIYYEDAGTHIGDAPWALPMESRLLKRHQFLEELKTGMQKPKSNSSAIRKRVSFAATTKTFHNMAQVKTFAEMLDSALETFIALNGDNGSVGEEAAQSAASRANVERGGTGLRLGDIIHFPTNADWARKDYTTYNYVGGCAVVIERGGYKVPANFSASFFNRALRELKNGEETGARVKCTGKPVEDFYGFGGTEASAIRAMAGAVIRVVSVKRIACNVFDHYDTSSELERKPVVYRKDVRPVFGFEYIELPEALRPKTTAPSGGSKSGSKGGSKPKVVTPNPLP